jgi:hypothetical protein
MDEAAMGRWGSRKQTTVRVGPVPVNSRVSDQQFAFSEFEEVADVSLIVGIE